MDRQIEASAERSRYSARIDSALLMMHTFSPLFLLWLGGRFVMDGSMTRVFIAHRLSTIRNAGLIVVVEDGGLVEQGSHDELIALGGHYAALVHSQALDKKKKIPSLNSPVNLALRDRREQQNGTIEAAREREARRG